VLEQFLPSFTWFNPTRVIFGIGELGRLPSVVDDVAGAKSRVFLVTGRSSLRARGILQKVMDAIGQERVTLFDQVTPFPSPDLVDTAVAACRQVSADVVVAIGGGSAMDLAKATAILMAHEGKSREYATREKSLQRRGLPFIAVPTTSGSSSEVTSGAALWDMEAKRHMGLGSPLMFPTVAIVDPELTMTMSKSLAAITGMDAFTSAFESYWSLEAEPIADAIDLEVIRLFNKNLERSSIQGDIESRAACALAATTSGIAYSNSHPNICHGVGAPLTLYWSVQHGQAVGVTLATFLRWNAQAIPHKLPALWDALGVKDLDEACARITRIMERCGLETRLSGLGIGESDMDTLIENIRWDRTAILPRPLEADDARQLLQALI
jgi:alcohol dehydrogenase class IV